MRKIIIVSTCSEDWGGSEELWGKSIPPLQTAGFEIAVVKYEINREHPQYVKLANNNVELIEIFPKKAISAKIKRKTADLFVKVAVNFKIIKPKGEDFSNYIKIMRHQSPSLVIISQGINFDGLKLAYQCLRLNIPYVVIAQKAVDFYWPYITDRAMMLEALLKAKKVFFVSRHNLRLTEEQFGKRLSNGQVIFNPVKLSNTIPYPTSTDVYKLACLGRLFVLDKGQDILIRIMSEEKWRNRPITISFIGKGNDEPALTDMVDLLNVTNVNFEGQIEDIEDMWKSYHALILPSRSEGLPLSMVEAMSAGRPVIISNAGGNTEMVEEGITGFIGHADEESFGEAMERAWNNRNHWEQIGKNAAKYIAEHVPKSPETEFANLIAELLIIK